MTTYYLTCIECNKDFSAPGRNAIRCRKCASKRKLSTFEKDIVQAVRDGNHFQEHIKAHLISKGRFRLSESRLMTALGSLRRKGVLETSMAGRTTIVSEAVENGGAA